MRQIGRNSPGIGASDDLQGLADALGLDLSDSQRAQIELLSKLRQSPPRKRAKPAMRPQTAAIAAQLESLKTINEGLQAHSEMIACALGACPSCWGSDVDCTECAGEGKSGFFLPDQACFETYVIPVLQRVLTDGTSNRGVMSIEKGEDNDERTE